MILPDLPCARLRPAVPADEAFLKTLYVSTRGDLAALAGDPVLSATLLDMQWRAQCAAYRSGFPDASDLIVEDGDGPAGRLLWHAGAAEWRVVDIALLPRARGRGIGGALLRALQHAAGAAGAPLHLSVRRDNPSARRLYASLGFSAYDGDAMMERMRWTAPA